MDKLSAEQIGSRMEQVADWSQNGEAIQRTYRFDNFVEAMNFVQRIADLAEQLQHHPDILIRYNKVTLTLTTHDAGGLTDRDFEFADAANESAPTF